MHSHEIFPLLEQIAAERKSTGKLALLKEHAGDATLQRVLELALNPLKTYGVKSLPLRGGSGAEPFGDEHWALIERLRTREVTGHAACDEIRRALGALDAGSAALLGRILRKDLRAGISDTTVNKVFAGLIPEFPYMRCSLPKDVKLAEWPWARGVHSQIKADGTFSNVSVEQDGQIFVTSRQRSEYPLESFGALADHLAAALAPGFQYHGELLVQRLQGDSWEILPREDGNGLLTSILKGGELPAGHRIIYRAWDTVPLSVVQPKGRYAVAYEDRLDAVISVKANDIMEPESADGYFSLFLPIFQERRLDKKVADTFECIREQVEEAVKA